MTRSAIIFLLLACIFHGDASAKRTIRRNLRSPDTRPVPELALSVDTAMIAIDKYDKPLRSRHESFFATNRTDNHVSFLKVRLQYLSLQGDTIHEAVRVLECDLPPRSTRRLTFPSWDKQLTLYYFLTDRPSRLHGTPYKVNIEPLEISIEQTP